MLVYVSGVDPLYHGKACSFQSILDSFWWTIVSLCTVGYGDVVPRTTLGRGAAGFTMIAGVLLLGFPVSIFSANFTEIYQKHRMNGEIKRLKRMRFREQLRNRQKNTVRDVSNEHGPKLGAKNFIARVKESMMILNTMPLDPQIPVAPSINITAEDFSSNTVTHKSSTAPPESAPTITVTDGRAVDQGIPVLSPSVTASSDASVVYFRRASIGTESDKASIQAIYSKQNTFTMSCSDKYACDRSVTAPNYNSAPSIAAKSESSSRLVKAFTSTPGLQQRNSPHNSLSPLSSALPLQHSSTDPIITTPSVEGGSDVTGKPSDCTSASKEIRRSSSRQMKLSPDVLEELYHLMIVYGQEAQSMRDKMERMELQRTQLQDILSAVLTREGK